jgi:hypothetical protein
VALPRLVLYKRICFFSLFKAKEKKNENEKRFSLLFLKEKLTDRP